VTRNGSPWTRAIIVGASSGIGAALVRELAAGGVRVAALARREDALEQLASEAPAGSVLPFRHDVTHVGEIPELFERVTGALGGLDLFIYASGVLFAEAQQSWRTDQDATVVAVNLTGAMAWINEVAPRLVAAKTGTIIGISSVAADRGRRGLPAYHASKAGLDSYLESVRHRIGRMGVAVVTSKPGPVETAILHGLPERPFRISPERAARSILRTASRGAGTHYVPWFWRPIMFAIRQIPGPLYLRVDL
jgi:NADP-dependent 3-hydroxy acid dehydrogenase YdfG